MPGKKIKTDVEHQIYDVIIVGGAIMGSAIAWFLSANRDFTGRVLVIERDFSYSTAATALSVSGIRHQYSNAINVQMSLYGTDFIRNFQQYLGDDVEVQPISFEECGYMFLASADKAHILRENHKVQTDCGAATVLMTLEEIAQKFPFYNLEGIVLGSFNDSGEGWFDGYGMMQSWQCMARKNGVEYIANEVVGIERQGNQIVSITLKSGEVIGCGVVVNAAGTRAAPIAQLADIHLPIAPRKRNVFVFDCHETLGQPLPLTIDPSGVYCRSEGALYITGMPPQEDVAVDPHDFDVDYAQFEQDIWPILANRIPAFEAIKMIRGWVGHYDYNILDQNAIIGSHPAVENFIFANGFTGHGLQQAPAVGRGLSELITYGQYKELDLSELSYDRIATNTPFFEKAII
jgi:glycine/D-amino acid oxidase-like deaminating enzyme